MAIKPASDWISSYEDLFIKKEVTVDKAPMLWGDWVDKNTQGLMGMPPYNLASATLNRPAFLPVSLPPAPTPDMFCNLLSTAWFTYIASSIWSIPPPAPPFSAITFVGPSMIGLNAAKAILFTNLLAIFSVPASTDPSFLKSQASQIGTAFYTATLASGIMITGVPVAVPPPVLILPQMPVQ
jgi:hypothetical protein